MGEPDFDLLLKFWHLDQGLQWGECVGREEMKGWVGGRA